MPKPGNEGLLRLMGASPWIDKAEDLPEWEGDALLAFHYMGGQLEHDVACRNFVLASLGSAWKNVRIIPLPDCGEPEPVKEKEVKEEPSGHYVASSCWGVSCHMCGGKASHKVGEEIPWDDPSRQEGPRRHNFTAYVCCQCFTNILGAATFCDCKPALSPPPFEDKPDEHDEFLDCALELQQWGNWSDDDMREAYDIVFRHFAKHAPKETDDGR